MAMGKSACCRWDGHAYGICCGEGIVAGLQSCCNLADIKVLVLMWWLRLIFEETMVFRIKVFIYQLMHNRVVLIEY